MDWVRINGRSYDVYVTAVNRTFNVIYTDKSGRTLAEGSPRILDPLGTEYGHTVTFARRKDNFKDFDDLWTCLSQPRSEGMDVDIVYNQSTLKYKAYCSTGTQNLKKIAKDKSVYWDILTVQFIPMRLQVEA